MTLTKIERDICGIVVRRFWKQHEATPRNDLLRAFKTPLYEPLQNLTNRSVLSAANQMAGSETYLPRAVAFHYCGDAEALAVARRSTEIVLQMLRHLFDVQLETGRKEPFTFADAVTEAMRISHDVNADMVWLGLYFAQEFSVFWTRQMDAKQIGVESFLLSEQIYRVVETENLWDSHILEGIKSVEYDWKAAQTDVAAIEAGRDDLGTIGSFAPIQSQQSRKVFLVHGRNEIVLTEVSALLKSLDLEAVILYKKPNLGRTLIEKFEKNSDVAFAVVLLTPDDVAAPIGQTKKKTKRARQNVILELGYFIAKLGRERVCALQTGEVELPSDIHGIVYVPYDKNGEWRFKLAEEINAAGIRVDIKKVATDLKRR